MTEPSTSLAPGTPFAPAASRTAATAADGAVNDRLGKRLRAVVLLGGSVRKTRLIEATGRSVAELPLTDRLTFLGQWVEQTGALAEHLGRASLTLRVVIGTKMPLPASRPAHPRVRLEVEGDSGDYRGTAGLLRDKTLAYDSSDAVLVANLGQLLLYPLVELAAMLEGAGGESSILAHRDGKPAGMMLFEVAALRDVPEIGYQDFKEQALPQIAERHDVRVVNAERHTGVPVRSRSDYLRAVRIHHRRERGLSRPGPFEEDWRSTFSLVESGAEVAGDARVHDSVVLRGAAVESGATLVRSLACPDSRTLRGARATDATIVGRWRGGTGATVTQRRVSTWHGWSRRRLVATGVLVLLAVLATLRAWIDMIGIALSDAESAYIVIVPGIAVWMVWVRRERIRLCRPGGEWIGPVLVAAGWVSSWIGVSGGYESLWHGGAVLAAVGAALSLLGTQVLVKFFPAFAALAFMVPVPGRVRTAVAIPLQNATAEATRVVLELCGFAVTRAGNMLHLNDMPIELTGNGNAMRMVFALVLVSYAFAFSTPLKNYVRLLILGLSPVTAVVLNVLRLAPTVVLYAHLSPGPASWFDRVSGWVMPVVAFLALLGVIRLLQWAMLPVSRYTLAYD